VILRDIQSPLRVSWSTRLKAWRHGFTGEEYVLYSLAQANRHDYLPDLRYAKTHPLNGPATTLIDYKLHLWFLLSDFLAHVPTYYALLDGGRVVGLPASGGAKLRTVAGLLDLLEREGRLALKLLRGTTGHGFLALAREASGYSVNGQALDHEELARRLSNLNGYLVTEYVRQHPYASAIYPGSVNTLRVLTIFDHEQGEAFIPVALHRFGTDMCRPVDNITRGGIYSRIDLASGRLSKALGFRRSSEITRDAAHPETGAAIEGVTIPDWASLRETVVRMANSLSFLPFMGWDLVVTPQGFKVLEINSLPGTRILQGHGPILTDSRVRAFFRNHPRGRMLVRPAPGGPADGAALAGRRAGLRCRASGSEGVPGAARGAGHHAGV
jgi:hypothetical protein